MSVEETKPPPGPTIGRQDRRSPLSWTAPGSDLAQLIAVPILVMILVIAAFAIAFTALQSASRVWYGSLYTFITFLLLTAVLAAQDFGGDTNVRSGSGSPYSAGGSSWWGSGRG